MQVEFPGLFDLQVNGFGGVDFNDPLATPEDVYGAIEEMRRTVVTRFLPTLVTSSFEHFAKCAKTLARTQHPAIAGLHMEGPHISPEDGARGAHPREHVVAASIDDFLRRQEAAAGQIKPVTLAHEARGAMVFGYVSGRSCGGPYRDRRTGRHPQSAAAIHTKRCGCRINT
jgi:N-acetylglucosamine-6-phosphate deacetylase